MNRDSHKSEKIHHYINRTNRKANLHEIKAETGAGNGFKNNISTTPYDNSLSKEALLHKSERIHHFISNTLHRVNLHHIKAETGAGNGFKDLNKNSYPPSSNNRSDSSFKSEDIHDAVMNATKKTNLHHIKAQTGAGNGFKKN